jgi:large repetitive protein
VDTIVARIACALRWRALCKNLSLYLGMLLATFLLCAGPARADDIEYAYDELGRLVQASNLTSGEAVLYTYDAAGNITSQTTRPLTTLSLGHFTPSRGPIGTQVTIHGTGFSTTPASNVVRFNGTAATVLSASQTQIVASVPPAATTGAIAVEVGAVTATSSTAFTVTSTGDTPTITALLPPSANPGASISIVGTNFEPVATQNRVRIGNALAQVISSTATTINVIVPPNAGSGRVRVTTPRGVAVSPADFIVLPQGYSASQIESSGRIVSDGTATTLAFPAAWRVGLRLFDGTVGELLTVGVSSMTLPSCVVRVFAPDGKQLVVGTMTASGQGLQLPKLPATGTYMIVVDNVVTSGNIALGVFKPLQATLTMNDAATNVSLVPPGRRALLTFDGTQGTYANVAVGGVAFAGTASVLSPTGAVLVSAGLSTSGASLQPLLPRSGTYSVLLDPAGSVGGTAAVSVAESAAPTLVANALGHSINLNNQTPVSVTFRGEPGQYMSIVVGATSLTWFSAAATVRNPDGSFLTSTAVNTSPQGSTFRGSRILNFGPLQFGGTYTVVVQQTSSVAGTVGLRLTTAQTGTLAVNSATGATITVPGQSVLRSFQGSAGQYLSFAVGESFGGISGAKITMLRPDGSVMATGDFTPPLARCGVLSSEPGNPVDPVFRCGRAVVNMGPLQVTGTYQVLLQQTDSLRVEDDYTGSYSLVLSTPVSGTLVADGAGAEPTIQFLGQGMKYTFAGTQGEYLSAGLVSTGAFTEGTVSNPLTAVVLDPDGAAIAAGGFVVTRHGVTVVNWFGSGVVNMGPLPVSGTYTLLLLQSGQALNDVTSVGIGLSTPLTGSFTPSSPSASRDVQRGGQGLLYGFPCVAGEYVSGAVGTANSSITAAKITVLGPDGAPLATREMTTVPVGGLQPHAFKGSTVVNAGPLASGGTCALLVQQTGSGENNIGSLGLRWSPVLTGALTLNAQTGVVVDNSGQGLLYTFDANAGDYRAVAVSVADPSEIKSASVSVLSPSGSVVASGMLSTVEIPGVMASPPTYEGAVLLNVGPLSATGTYKVLVQQTGSGATQTGGFGIVLSEPVTGSVPVGGSANAALGLRGQGARYTFSGSGGQHLSLCVTETNGQISSASIKILDPFGNTLKTGSLGATPLTCTGCNGYAGTTTVDSGLLPATGTYSVLIQQTGLPPFDTDRMTPYLGGSGTLALELTELQPGTGATANINTTVPGQVASTTFAAAAGQTVSVAFTNPVLSPSGATTFWINLYAPNGAHVSGVSCWSAGSCDVLHVRQLPQTGTYRVDVTPPSTHTISGTLTIASALTGALAPSVPFNAIASVAGQGAHLSFIATQGQTFTVALSSLSTTPANSRMYMNVYNAAGAIVANSSTTSSNLTFNLPNLAAGTYYVWVAPQYAVTSTMQVTLHPRVGGTLQADGTPASFSTTASGQAAYFDFAATAGQSVSVAIQNVVLTPSAAASYYIYVWAPDGAQVGFVNCWSGSTFCDVIHMRNLARTGTYRIELYTPATQMLSGKLTVSQDLTGTLSTGAPLTFGLDNVGQGVHLSFTATAGETFALALSSLTTLPANSRMYMNVYNAAGTIVANSSTTSSNLTFNLPNLAAGTYYAWIAPQFPVTSTLQVMLHPRAGGTLQTNGTSSSFSTTAFGQIAYFDFSASAGQSLSVAIQNVVLTPSDAASYYIYVWAPDGAQVGFVNCWSGSTFCDVIHMRNLAQTGTYRVEIYTPANQRMSGTLTVSQDLTGTLNTGVPLSFSPSKVGQGAHLSFTATAGETVAVALSSLSTTPANSRMYMNVYNAAGALVANSSTTTSSLTFNLRNLAADTYYVWVAPQYPVTSTFQVKLHPRAGSSVAPNGTSANFNTTAVGQTAYFDFAATAGQSVSVAIQNVVLTPSDAASYYIYVWAPDGAQAGFVNCWSGSAACDVIHMRNLAQTGIYRIEIYTPVTQTMSGTLTVSQDLTGTLNTGVPASLSFSNVGQGAHLSFTATAGQTLALALSSLSTTPANSRMYMNVYNAAGQLLYSNSTTTANLTINLPNLAAGTYYAWIAPQFPVTSTVDVTLHPQVGGTASTDGTPASFSTLAAGQIAYYEFAATAGQSVSVALTNVALSPSTQAQYFASVFAPNGSNLGWIGCWSTWTACDVLHMRNLPQTGTYRVELSTYATHTLSGTLTVSVAQTGTLSPDVPLDLTLNAPGQGAYLNFTATAGQTVSVHIGMLNTVPANTRLYMHLYNAAGTYLGGTSSTVGASFVLPNLAAGTYYAWIVPQYPATSTVRTTMQPAVAVPTDGTATSFDTTAAGQSRTFTFSGTAGGSVSIALSDIVASPSTSPVQYWFAVFRPDGQNVWTNGCWSSSAACDVMHLRDMLAGTYRIEITTAATHTLSGTLTLTQALTGTLTSGVPTNVSLPLLGQTMMLGMTLSSAQPVSVTGTSISTTPAGRPMQIYVFNPAGSLIASNSGTAGISVNMGTLQAGAYKVWIVPQYPSTSSLVVGY